MARLDRTAPTPVSEASTSRTNCLSGSGWVRTGAETKRCQPAREREIDRERERERERESKREERQPLPGSRCGMCDIKRS